MDRIIAPEFVVVVLTRDTATNFVSPVLLFLELETELIQAADESLPPYPASCLLN
jgi:hypothetical protein